MLQLNLILKVLKKKFFGSKIQRMSSIFSLIEADRFVNSLKDTPNPHYYICNETDNPENPLNKAAEQFIKVMNNPVHAKRMAELVKAAKIHEGD